MTQITSKTESIFPRAFGKAKRDRPWVTRHSANSWRVVPRTLKDGSREHGKYLVRFIQWGEQIFADCVNVITGEPCKSSKTKGRLCYHQAAALLSCQKSESRKVA